MEIALKKILFIFLITVASLFSYEYDDTIMSIEAKLFPKIALMEQHIRQKTKSSLDILILYKEIDKDIAKKFAAKIKQRYTRPLLDKKIYVDTALLSKIKKLQKVPDVIIVLSYDAKEMRFVAAWANKNRVVSFVYEPENLKYGFLGSVYIGKTVKPYLNKQTIKEHGFVFTPYLLQLSKFK